MEKLDRPSPDEKRHIEEEEDKQSMSMTKKKKSSITESTIFHR